MAPNLILALLKPSLLSNCLDLYNMGQNGEISEQMCNPLQDAMDIPCGCCDRNEPWEPCPIESPSPWTVSTPLAPNSVPISLPTGKPTIAATSSYLQPQLQHFSQHLLLVLRSHNHLRTNTSISYAFKSNALKTPCPNLTTRLPLRTMSLLPLLRNYRRLLL